MTDRIICSNCHKSNDIQKFCIYCGRKLLDDEQIKSILNDPNPYCLNCGRPTGINQIKCECGHEFADIKCPNCETKNEYTNKFCTSCGEKLWKSDVNSYKYKKRLFEYHLLNESLPYELRNLTVFKRSKNQSSWFDGDIPFNLANSNQDLDLNLEKLKSKALNVDKNLYEICSRWSIASPNRCINCFSVCSDMCSCMTPFLTNEKRIEFLQNAKNYYINPRFDNEELKWASKNNPERYLGSLAPAIGESQLEYRERLKWDFAANVDRKERIRNAMDNITRAIKQKNSKPSTFNTNQKGNYCNINCIHYYEEFLDSRGGIVGDFDSEGYVEYYCNLGHSIVHGRFCEDYE